jgi:hypothetical protein
MRSNSIEKDLPLQGMQHLHLGLRPPLPMDIKMHRRRQPEAFLRVRVPNPNVHLLLHDRLHDLHGQPGLHPQQKPKIPPLTPMI